MCPSAGPGSVVALGYLMSLFRMVCQSALTVHCFVKWGRRETPRIPHLHPVMKYEIIPPLFTARFELMCKYVAFGSSRQSLRSVRCKLNVKEPPGNVKFCLLQIGVKQK